MSHPLAQLTRTPVSPADRVFPTHVSAADLAHLMSPARIHGKFGEIATEGLRLARCVSEPHGDNGLEGYQLGDLYLCEKVIPEHAGQYWRVWVGDDCRYYETCGPEVFRRYFQLCPQAAATTTTEELDYES